MKILVICPLTSNSGGSVTSWSISKQLADMGHTVYFIERGFRKESKKQATNIHYLHSVDFVPFLPLNILLSMLFNILAVIILRPDLVFALKPLPNSCLPAIIAKLFGTKNILHINDLDYEFYKDGILKKIMKFFYRFFPSIFDKVSFPSPKLMDYVREDIGLPEEKTMLLLQGVDCQRFKNISAGEELKESLKLTGKRIIVYIASLGITASFETIAGIFYKILQSAENTRILVIGDGFYLQKFKQDISKFSIDDKVVFTGFVKYDRIPAYINLADIGINYMDEDKANSFRVPIKVKEYLAAGLPVVCNDVGDYEILRDHINIAADEDQFVSMVLKLLENGYGRDEREIRFMEDNYSWSKIIQDFNSNINLFVNPAVT